MDTSRSQRNVLEPERKASYTFLDQVLREGRDRAFVARTAALLIEQDLGVVGTLEDSPKGDNVRVTLDFPPALPPVLADADQARIVFANLVRNAREAMPQGGALTVEGRQAGDRVEVAVRDTGAGIAPELLGRVTEPLY